MDTMTPDHDLVESPTERVASTQSDRDEVFRRFEAFDFRHDTAYQVRQALPHSITTIRVLTTDPQAGLAKIMASDATLTPEVVRMAKVFFYTQ